MSRYAALLSVIVLLIGGMWTASTVAFPDAAKDRRPHRAPKDKVDDVRAQFEALKKRLPKIVSAWCKTAWVGEPKARVARLTSPTEAKYTFETKTPAEFGLDREHLFTLYLRYFDGRWTVLRWEAGGDNLAQDRIGLYMQKLAMAVDQSDGE
jgi:hypothetical protein